jgi:dienelactone hydrolase
VHGGAGLDEHAKRRARRFADSGFIAFACDMYGDGVAGDRQRVISTAMELSKNSEKIRGRVSAGLATLRSHPLVDDRVAAVGYCFGGLTVLELARSGADVLGVVSVHGSLHTLQPAQPGGVKAKILVCHGGRDPHVPMSQVDAFVEEMKAASADFQLIVYGLAMHGFTHDDGPAMPGVAYDALTDARSEQAIQAFFAEIFGAGGSAY